MSFFEGFGFGLATALLIGPVFFTLLKAAIQHGAFGGIMVALGIIASDLLIVAICITGLVNVIGAWLAGPWMAIAAALILFGTGLHYILRPALDIDAGSRPYGLKAMGLFTAGFLVNFVNPFVFAIWIGLILHATKLHGVGSGTWTFIAGVLLGIFSTDLAKAILATQLRRVLSPFVLKRVYRVIGVILLLFGVRVLVHALNGWA